MYEGAKTNYSTVFNYHCSVGCLPGEDAGTPGLHVGEHDAARPASGGRVPGPPRQALAAPGRHDGRGWRPSMPGGLPQGGQHSLRPAYCAALCAAAHRDPPGQLHGFLYLNFCALCFYQPTNQ
jgi:hypothetical protein